MMWHVLIMHVDLSIVWMMKMAWVIHAGTFMKNDSSLSLLKNGVICCTTGSHRSIMTKSVQWITIRMNTQEDCHDVHYQMQLIDVVNTGKYELWWVSLCKTIHKNKSSSWLFNGVNYCIAVRSYAWPVAIVRLAYHSLVHDCPMML